MDLTKPDDVHSAGMESFRMKIPYILGLAATVALLIQSSIGAAEKVIISYSSRSYAFLPAQVAEARGFFKDENIEPLLIQMRSQVAVLRQYHRRSHAGHAVQNSRGANRQTVA